MKRLCEICNAVEVIGRFKYCDKCRREAYNLKELKRRRAENGQALVKKCARCGAEITRFRYCDACRKVCGEGYRQWVTRSANEQYANQTTGLNQISIHYMVHFVSYDPAIVGDDFELEEDCRAIVGRHMIGSDFRASVRADGIPAGLIVRQNNNRYKFDGSRIWKIK